MTVKDVVELSAVYLQLEDVLSTSDFASSINAITNSALEVSEITQRNLNLLIRCTDLTLKEIATDFLPLKKKVIINTNDKKLEYADFASPVLKIIEVKKHGKKIDFKLFSTYIELSQSGEIEVVYNALPASVSSLAANIDEVANIVEPRILAYGVAKEYCYISSLYDEGAMWEEKFKNALASLTKSRVTKVKARRWF